MINEIRYTRIGTLPNGVIVPLVTHPQAMGPIGWKNPIASVSIQTNARGETTGLLNFAGTVQASLVLTPDGNTVTAYTLFNLNADRVLQESVETICKAIHLFLRVENEI